MPRSLIQHCLMVPIVSVHLVNVFGCEFQLVPPLVVDLPVIFGGKCGWAEEALHSPFFNVQGSNVPAEETSGLADLVAVEAHEPVSRDLPHVRSIQLGIGHSSGNGRT